uniref:Uncharacterized protein n=1 Tax=Arion vulgaris TaxID=1028688 RepID=A0A0B7AW73_9EUPU
MSLKAVENVPKPVQLYQSQKVANMNTLLGIGPTSWYIKMLRMINRVLFQERLEK